MLKTENKLKTKRILIEGQGKLSEILEDQWNRSFIQSMLLGLLLMFFGLFAVDSKAAEPELRMGKSTYSDFKEIVPDQSE